jgi:Flp pilus assembly protein TadD
LEAATLDYLSAVSTAPRAARYRVQFRDAVMRLPAALSVDEAVTPAMYFSDAAVQFRAQNQGQALLALLRCLKRDPDHIEARLNLGTIFAQLACHRLARMEWERCLSIDPSYAPARTNLAQLAAMHPHATQQNEAKASSKVPLP